MTVKGHLVDPLTGEAARVCGDSLIVAQSPNIAVLPQLTAPFAELLATAAGLEDATTVVGTATDPIIFKTTAPTSADRYVTQLSFLIVGSGANMSDFGTGAALTNGCLLRWISEDDGEVQIGVPLKSNWDFVRLSQGNPAFGTTTSSFRASNVVGTAEAYIPVVDFRQFCPPGLRLPAGSTARLEVCIQDEILGASASQFDFMAYGFDRKV